LGQTGGEGKPKRAWHRLRACSGLWSTANVPDWRESSSGWPDRAGPLHDTGTFDGGSCWSGGGRRVGLREGRNPELPRLTKRVHLRIHRHEAGRCRAGNPPQKAGESVPGRFGPAAAVFHRHRAGIFFCFFFSSLGSEAFDHGRSGQAGAGLGFEDQLGARDPWIAPSGQLALQLD